MKMVRRVPMNSSSRNGGTRSRPPSSKISSPRIPNNPPEEKDLRKTLIMALVALGVVYGDIGTSPLIPSRNAFTAYMA